jgi:hypothetical protein
LILHPTGIKQDINFFLKCCFYNFIKPYNISNRNPYVN